MRVAVSVCLAPYTSSRSFLSIFGALCASASHASKKGGGNLSVCHVTMDTGTPAGHCVDIQKGGHSHPRHMSVYISRAGVSATFTPTLLEPAAGRHPP